MLARERAFEGPDTERVVEAVKRAEPTPIQLRRPEVSDEVASVLARALERDPARRFQDASELLHALQPHYDPNVGTPLAVSAVVRGLFGTVRANVAKPPTPP